MERHVNSKKVRILRLDDFLARAQGQGMLNFMTNSSNAIGSYYEKDSPTIGTGFRVAELDIIMPIILQTDPKDREYRREVSKFFNELDTKIPFNGGREFEIGLEKDNSKPLSEDNLPINMMDYIRYRHALGHPNLATDLEGGKGNQTKQWYVFDPEKEEKKLDTLAESRDEAMLKYLDMSKKEDKLDAIITMIKEDIRKFPRLSDKQKLVRAYVESKPDEFLKILETNHLDDIVWIRRMVLANQIKVIGGRYTIANSMEYLGASEEEAAATLKSPDMKEIALILKGETQTALKPATAKGAKTSPATK